jgi:ATP-dependent Clp protease protease subunit
MERTILVNGYFEKSMLVKFHTALRAFEEENHDEINLLIDSPGGQVSVLNTMLSLIEASPCNFNTVCVGVAASCGFFLFVLGAKNGERLIFPHAQLMCHSASGYEEDVEDEGEVEKINNTMLAKMANVTNRSIAELEEYVTRDYFFMGSDCVTEGFATDAITIS